jgi:glycosyltransferase involved in cell wall biosynthesis
MEPARKIKILFVSQHVVNNSTFQAGHKSFGYYLSNFCNDEAFEVGYLVDYNSADEAFAKMKNQYSNALDFSISTPVHIRAFKYIFYSPFLRLLCSIINPAWIYFNPFRSFVYKKALVKINKQGWVPDVIAFEWTEVIFLREFCHKLFNKAVLLATEHDVSFNKLSRQYAKNIFFKTFILNRFKKKEIDILKALDTVLVLSNNDALLLEENGIDKDKILLISPYYNRTNQKQAAIKPDVIFFGAMNRLENLEAVKWFLDNVYIPYQLYDSVSLIVIGAGIPDDFKRKYRDVKNVRLTGFVERPEEYFESALCMVVPLTYGGGIKIKVLEAMSGSVAVLSNDIGIEGIKAIPDVNYIHCSEPVHYYNAIIKLSEDYNLVRSIGEAGRLMMESNYNYGQSYSEYRNKIISLYNNARQ